MIMGNHRRAGHTKETHAMSADNWTACPRCNRNQIEQLKQEATKVQDMYGKVDRATYMAAIEKFHEAEQALPRHDYTFREDYEIGVIDDELFISYTGRCKNCGFVVQFKHTKSVFE
jgi:hypothetical protein